MVLSKNLLLVMFFAAAPLAPAFAAQAAVVPAETGLSLADVIHEALTRDPRRPLVEAYREEAKALRRNSSGLLSDAPALSLRHQTDQPLTNDGLREWEANLELPLWCLGQRKAARKSARAAEQLAGSSERATLLIVSGVVRDALWELALAEERATLAEQAVKAASDLEQDVVRRVNAGDLARVDRLLAQEEVLRAQEEAARANSALLQAADRYRRVTGNDRRPARFEEMQSTLTEIPADHPLLVQAGSVTERQRSALAQARKAGVGPQLIIGARQERSLAGEPMQNSVGIGVRVPFAQGRYRAPAIAAAGTALAEARSQERTLLRELEIERSTAEQTVTALKASVTMADEQDGIARESFRLAHIAFGAGELDLAELLRVHARALSAQRNARLRHLEWQQAIARYNQAVGVIP